MKSIPILIVGAGPVGLSMALNLARHNICSCVVERNSGISRHPKARGVNVRTMELFRQWGNDIELLKYEQPKEARRFIWAESLQGEEITRIAVEDTFIGSYSPTQSSLVSQDHVEESLRNSLKNYRNTEVHFSKEVISFEQDPSEVTIQILDQQKDQIELVRAQYLIGADGTRSTTRQQLGITMQGPGDLGYFCSVYCTLDLSPWLKHRPCIGFFFTDPKLGGRSFFSIDGKNHWIVGMRFLKENSRDDFTDTYCIQEIQRIVGKPDLSVQILNKNFWTMGAQIANQYRVGRVFLTGDAAHQLPPTGGLGMNTGIQDVHNLAWKLAWVLKYGISDSLLDSYYNERVAVAEQNMEWSLQNAKRYVEIAEVMRGGNKEKLKIKLKEQHQNLNHPGLDLGFVYHSKAVISENEQTLSISPSIYRPTTLPGSRAPHVRLIQKGKVISTLDLFENEFVLLVGNGGQKWQMALGKLNLQFPVKIYRVADDGDLQDPEETWHNIYEVEKTGAVLVRPDGHVAWRCQATKDSPSEVLKTIFGLLGLL